MDVSKACPWASRTLIVRALKGLEKAIPVFYAAPYMAENGWEFSDGGIHYLHELYSRAQPGYTGRVTVPVLWDKKARRIVNNESAEILRMLNRDFNAFARRKLADLYPEELRREIDWLNERIYRTVNNGVYRAGFATLVRFDAVYYSHFKCNLRRLVDYPNLWRYTRRLYALPGVKSTTSLTEIKDHYYRSHTDINPTQIVPKGPLLDFRLH